MLTRKATSLEEVYQTLDPKPLETEAEFDAFYRFEVNEVRGGDKVQRLKLGLGRAHGGAHYKALFTGHQGVGKSTELSRLTQEIHEQYQVIRFSALSDLDPVNFKPLDVLLLMMAEVAERTALPREKGGAGQKIPEQSLREILDWFAQDKNTYEQKTDISGGIEAGAGIDATSPWTKVLGLFAKLKGEIKYASTRKEEVVEYRLRRLNSLMQVVNNLMDECNKLLRQISNQEWLFIGEDFDKVGIAATQIEDLFIKYSSIFRDIRSHLIFSIPIALDYSTQANYLSFSSDQIFILPDTPVYHPDQEPHEEGRQSIASVLDARLDSNLFEEGQKLRLIVASGGNLRNLFSLISEASDTAILDKRDKIGARDVDAAINELRSNYERSLGQSVFDKVQIPYVNKAERLMQVYNQQKEAQVPDPVLYLLLQARAVQEFNGSRWFGLHPLVVDILHAQGRILQSDGVGGVRGGSI